MIIPFGEEIKESSKMRIIFIIGCINALIVYITECKYKLY